MFIGSNNYARQQGVAQLVGNTTCHTVATGVCHSSQCGLIFSLVWTILPTLWVSFSHLYGLPCVWDK